MAGFWRPFEETTPCQPSAAPSKESSSSTRLRVTNDEVEIILEVYSIFSGWDEIITNVKKRISDLPLRGVKSLNLKEYYKNTGREAIIKRIRRIVSQNVSSAQAVNLKAQEESCASNVNQSVRMSETILEAKTRYSKKRLPEDRAMAKMSYATLVDGDESTHSLQEEETEEEETLTMDVEQDSIPKHKCKIGKKGKKRKSSQSLANEAHTKMCAKAMKMMNKMEKILNKLESGDETD